jgi:Flp pilus assembly protein TadG
MGGARRGGGGTATVERGQAMPVIILLFVVMCGFVGLTIDVGYGMLQKRRLQAAVDLGLLSGATELPDASLAAVDAEGYTRENFAMASEEPIAVSTSTSCMVAGCRQHDRLALAATTTTPTFFLKLFGKDSWQVGARGAACGPCDSSPVSYDVVVVLDRSYSMCIGANGTYNGCADLDHAKSGIEDLLSFFDPATDRVSLAVLSSSDTTACSSGASCRTTNAAGRPYSHSTARPSYTWTPASSSPAPCDSANPSDATASNMGPFYRSAGDFMDGTASSHDSWVLVPLANGTDFKRADGSINPSSGLVSTLRCVNHKYWTPIAPAVYEATEELRLHGRLVDDDGNEVYRAIVMFGDGGANVQPMRRADNGTVTTSSSWYTATSGNHLRPCHDAVGQAQRAWAYGIHVYTIGYALDEGAANLCVRDNHPDDPAHYLEPGINARTTLQQMAQGDGEFYESSAGDVSGIFNEIGHAITAGGTRLVE